MAAIDNVRGSGGGFANPLGALSKSLMDYGMESNRMALQKAKDEEARRRWEIGNARAQEEANVRRDERNRLAKVREDSTKILGDFAANPYGAEYGAGKETALGDKRLIESFETGKMSKLMDQYNQIQDKDKAEDFYMKNIDPVNRRLQETYEQVRPFQEDAQAALTSQLLATGVNPNQVTAMAKGATSQLTSRVDAQKALQNRVDAYNKAQRDTASRNLAVAKYLNPNKKGRKATSSTKKSLKTMYDTEKELDKMGLSPWTAIYDVDREAAEDMIQTAVDSGYSVSEAVKAAKNAYQGGGLFTDDKINEDKFFEELGKKGKYKQDGNTSVDAETLASFFPKQATAGTVGYTPEKFDKLLEEALGGTPSTGGAGNTVSQKTGSTGTGGQTPKVETEKTPKTLLEGVQNVEDDSEGTFDDTSGTSFIEQVRDDNPNAPIVKMVDKATDTYNKLLGFSSMDSGEKENTLTRVRRNLANAERTGKKVSGKTASQWQDELDLLRNPEQINRRIAIADAIKDGEPLTSNQKRWVEDNKKTKAGRKLLKELGITEETPVSLLEGYTSREDDNARERVRQETRSNFLQDPASILNPNIPQEVRDRYRMLQAAQRDGLLLR